MATISTHNGSTVHQAHNLRTKSCVEKEPHIDPNGVHEIWKHEPISAAYHRIFDDAVAEYNSRQTRADRQIRNYLTNVRQDDRKHACYEMIIGVYGNDCSTEQGYQIMRKFVDGWQERNPNLELIGAYYHADEAGQPHVHLDYIPVAHGYRNGMHTQNGLVKALGEMGLVKSGKATAQIKWEARENAYLDQLCQEHGITVEHPRIQGIQHADTAVYQANQDAAKARQAAAEAQQEAVEAAQERDRLKAAVEPYKELQTSAEEIERSGLNLGFGVLLGREDAQAYKEQAKAYQMNRDEIEGQRERSAALDQRELQLDQREAELDDREMELERSICRNRNVHQLLKKSEQQRAEQGERITSLQTQVDALREELARVERTLNQQIQSLQGQLRGAYEAVRDIVQAAAMIREDDSEYQADLTPKQEQLLDGIADYAADLARQAGHEDLAEEIDEQYGLSDAITPFVEPAEPADPEQAAPAPMLDEEEMGLD